jgi:hypothetical protein
VSTGTFSGTPYTPDPYGGEWAEGGQNVHTDPESHRGWWLPLPDQFPRNIHSEGYVSQLVVCSGPCRLFGVTGYCSNTSGEFILIYDLSGTLPASGANATVCISTGTAASNFSWYGGTVGRWMQRGIVVVVSSTAPTYTAGSADTFIDVQYA